MNTCEIYFQLKLFIQIAIEILTVKKTEIFSTSFEQGIIPPYTQIPTKLIHRHAPRELSICYFDQCISHKLAAGRFNNGHELVVQRIKVAVAGR